MAPALDRVIQEKGLTNRAVAELIGSTEHQVWRWRHGKIRPSRRNLMALVDKLCDGDLAAFFGSDEQEPLAA